MSIFVKIQKQLRSFALQSDFQVSNRILGILGASGSGKSMTLKSIAGIVTPDSGRITMNDVTLFDSERKIDLPIQKRKTGYLFQSYALFPHMTVEQNIACAIQQKMKHKKQFITELLERFDLHGFESRYPNQLSGGEQQRVAFARILAYDPNVLLLDEPFSALDGYLKEKIQIDMIDWLKEYTGNVLMVTHSRDEVFRICQDLLIMDKGEIIETGTVKDVFSRPKRIATAKLTGCKNISRAKKINEHMVRAEDWAISLHVVQRIPNDLSYIGIRAHDFLPRNQKETMNTFPVLIQKQIETSFEWNILFQVIGLERQETALWWKYAKTEIGWENTKYLHIPPESILLLSE